MQNGTVDIECGSTTNNATRQKDVAFALTTYVTEVRTAVKADSGINSVADLNDKNVATTTGTTSVQRCCARTSAPRASSSRRCTARTTPTASCCWSPAAPTPS